jgi:hypothetical protein
MLLSDTAHTGGAPVPIMSFATWKTQTTRGVLTPRSTELKAIGTALQNYHANGRTRPLLLALRQALDDWMGTKDDWQTSTRNRDGTVATLNDQVNQALGPGVRVTRGAIQRRREQLTAPAPTRPPGTSLTTNALVRDFCDAIKDNVHTPWDTLTADERAGGMHQALADLFPRMNNMPAPGLALVADRSIPGDRGAAAEGGPCRARVRDRPRRVDSAPDRREAR